MCRVCSMSRGNPFFDDQPHKCIVHMSINRPQASATLNDIDPIWNYITFPKTPRYAMSIILRAKCFLADLTRNTSRSMEISGSRDKSITREINSIDSFSSCELLPCETASKTSSYISDLRSILPSEYNTSVGEYNGTFLWRVTGNFFQLNCITEKLSPYYRKRLSNPPAPSP